MLYIRAYINDKLIGEVAIQNTGETIYPGLSMYKVHKPEGCNTTFLHTRSKGWMDLAANVLGRLVKGCEEDEDE